MHVIETTSNPEGASCVHSDMKDPYSLSAVCALSPFADASYLAYPSPVPSPTTPLSQQPAPAQPSSSSQQSGDVILFSTKSLTVANVIQAHKSPISFLSINSTGTLLGTASDKGTVIRVWSIPGAEKLYQFRRGTREARIYSMNFNAMSTLLAVSSAHDTVHIFKLGPQKPSPTKTAPPVSPSGSVDSREGTQGMEGGYEEYIDGKKKSGSVSCVHQRCILRYAFDEMHSFQTKPSATLFKVDA